MHSGNKAFLFFGTLSIFSIFSILLTSPNLFNASEPDVNTPSFSLYEFDYYSMKPGITNVYTHVKEARRLKNQDILYNAAIHRNSENNTRETLIASELIHDNRHIVFPQKVHYSRNDGLSFWSEKTRYAMDTDELLSEGKFELVNNGLKAKGINLKVDRKKGTITAEKINAFVDPQ